MASRDVQAREIEYHETVYSGFAQQHFAKPAVRAFRRHLAGRVRRVTGVSRLSRVLSLGCGIGDTELLLAPYVEKLIGIDLAPSAIQQAKADTEQRGVTNAEFLDGDLNNLQFAPASFDIIMAVFFMHHLPDEDLGVLAARISTLLAPGGIFYSLDPGRYRLAGAIGKLVASNLMKKHQSPDERELSPTGMCGLFSGAGLAVTIGRYDFLSTPLAGLFPGARSIYRIARRTDDVLVHTPLLCRLGSNFELIARKKGG